MGVALPQAEPCAERRGYCSRCGECCFPDPSVGNSLFTDEQRNHIDRIKGACPMLRQDEDGTYSCAGYGWHPFYQAGCFGHPWSAGDLELTPSCTYSFVIVNQ